MLRYPKCHHCFIVLIALLARCSCFLVNELDNRKVAFPKRRSESTLRAEEKPTSGFEETDAASKGFVSSLTNLVNSLASSTSSSGPSENNLPSAKQMPVQDPPRSPAELLERIKQDYTVKNYLWTGEIDLSAFDEQCRFTDPTLSFTGTSQFVENIKNLRPIVDTLVRPGGSSSNLLDIQLNERENYVQTRWNMVGELSALPWKPKIDVIGRTKFWYNNQTDSTCTDIMPSCYRVVFYDEEWELPAFKALLQLVTPAGTISKSQCNK